MNCIELPFIDLFHHDNIVTCNSVLYSIMNRAQKRIHVLDFVNCAQDEYTFSFNEVLQLDYQGQLHNCQV